MVHKLVAGTILLLAGAAQASAPGHGGLTVPHLREVSLWGSLSQFGDDFGGVELQGIASIVSIGVVGGLRYQRLRVPHNADGALYHGGGVDLGFQWRPLQIAGFYDGPQLQRWFDPHFTVGGFLGGVDTLGFVAMGYVGAGADVCILPLEPLARHKDPGKRDRAELGTRQIALTAQYRYLFDTGHPQAASHELLLGIAYRVVGH